MVEPVANNRIWRINFICQQIKIPVGISATNDNILPSAAVGLSTGSHPLLCQEFAFCVGQFLNIITGETTYCDVPEYLIPPCLLAALPVCWPGGSLSLSMNRLRYRNAVSGGRPSPAREINSVSWWPPAPPPALLLPDTSHIRHKCWLVAWRRDG